MILVDSSLEPEQAARYYADGGAGANNIINSVLTSSTRMSAAELGTAFYGTLLNTPEDGAPAWAVCV